MIEIVGYIVKVVDTSIAEVHVAEISAAYAIPRVERFSEAQRGPAEAATQAEAKSTEAKAYTPARTTEPSHQRGSVPRACPVGTRSPTPASAPRDPAAIVKRREAPGIGIDPGPSPGGLVDPVAGAVRRPTRTHCIRNPHRSVVRGFFPGAVLVEIVGSDNAGSHIFGGDGMIGALIAHATPLIKSVGTRRASGLVGQRISAAELQLLAFVNTHARALSCGLAFALKHGNESRVSIRVHIETVVTGLPDGERQIRSINLPNFAAVQMADVHIQRALVERYLHGIVAHIGESQAGLRVDAEQARAQIQFGAGIFVRPDVVGIGERAVGFPLHPVIHPVGLNRDLSTHVLQAGYAARRILR